MRPAESFLTYSIFSGFCRSSGESLGEREYPCRPPAWRLALPVLLGVERGQPLGAFFLDYRDAQPLVLRRLLGGDLRMRSGLSSRQWSVLAASEGSLVRFESASSRPTRFIISGMASELTASEPKLSVGRRPFFMTRSRTILLVVRASDATPMSMASFALK